jgi:hypothetical protein
MDATAGGDNNLKKQEISKVLQGGLSNITSKSKNKSMNIVS